MVMKIEKSNITETAEIMNWLIQHVGDRITSSGVNVNGHGWTIRPNVIQKTYIVELNPHVDDETILMFMLKWS